MQAQSLVVGVRSLDRRARDLLGEPRLSGKRTPIRGHKQLSTLCSIDALVAVSAPLPVPESKEHPDEPLVRKLLDRLYAEGALNRESLDTSLVTAAAESNRVKSVGSFLLIPLDSDGVHEHNWGSVFRLLSERLADIERKFERIVARITGAALHDAVGRVWQTGVEMLRETRQAIRIQLARQARLQRLYARPSSEPTDFANWTINTLTDVTGEP